MKVWGIVILVGIFGLFQNTVSGSEEESGANSTITTRVDGQPLSAEVEVKTAGNETRKDSKKGAGGVLGSYLAGIGSESLQNNADKIKPPPPSITRRPSPPLNIGSVWNKNQNIGVGGNLNNANSNPNFGGGVAGGGQGQGGGVRRRRPRPPPQEQQYAPPPLPPPSYNQYQQQQETGYDLPNQRPLPPPLNGGGGYRPPPPNFPPPQQQHSPQVRPPVQAPLPPPQGLPPLNKPLTDEQKLAYHYLQLLEEKDKQGGGSGALAPPQFVLPTTPKQVPTLIEVATTPDYDDYDPDYPDRRRRTTPPPPPPTPPPTRRRRRRTTTLYPPQAPYQQQQQPPQQQNYYPPPQQQAQQPPYNPYLPPPQPQQQQPPAYYPPPPQQPPYSPPLQSPQFVPPLTPSQFQQLQQQQLYAPPPQYQQQQPIYPPQQQQPYYPPPPQQPIYPQGQPGGYQPIYPPPNQPIYPPAQLPATTPLEDYDYVDNPTKKPPTTPPPPPPFVTPTPDTNDLQHQQFLQFQRLQQLKLLIELHKLRAQESSTTHNPNATTTESPYVYVPRLFINPYIAPTKLTTTTDNPDDAVQGLANFFGSLASGNLAGVVDGGIKYASSGVFDNLNNYVACQMGNCGDEQPSGAGAGDNKLVAGGGGLFGGGASGNKGPLGGKTDKYSYIPHQPQHPYPGQRPKLEEEEEEEDEEK